MRPERVPRLVFPPGVHPEKLEYLAHGAFSMPADGVGRGGATDFRRSLTEKNPLLFAITYFSDWLTDEETGVMSFCRMHLEMCLAAKEWMTPGPSRHAWIAPRQAGKSRWLFGVLPIWAMAHGYRDYVTAFAYTEKQAAKHVANILDRIKAVDSLLLADFPELAPARGKGGPGRTVLQNGATLDFTGMGGSASGQLGVKGRPNLIIGDDIDPDSEKNTPKAAAQNRGRFQKTILPLNIKGSVHVAGTVTMYDSFIHDFVHAAKGRPKGDWVAAQRFNVHHYPPIQADGSSLWPQKWSLEELHKEKEADEYAYELNYNNDPRPPKGKTFWTPGIFQYDRHFEVVERVLIVDVAFTVSGDADFTCFSMAGPDRSGRKVLSERTEWGHWTIDEMRDRLHSFCDPLTVKPEVWIERNKGGEHWLQALRPWPVGVEIKTFWSGAPKDDRIRWGHEYYRARAVWHPWKDPDLEHELCMWPRGRRDDVPDAVTMAIGRCFRAPWAMT